MVGGEETSVVRIDHLTAGYGNDVILDDVSFDVPDGKLFGVVGPNGAGKSTLVRSFFGISRVFSGSIWIDNRDITKLPIETISSLVAVQRPIKAVDIQLTVIDYIKAGAIKVSIDDVNRVIDEFQLENITGNVISSLSDGQMQRVNLAQAVVRNPRVFLLDEPTAHLDLKYRYQLLSGIKDRLNETTCGIAVIHDLDLAREFCDHMVLMRDGKVDCVDSVDVLDDKKMISALFGLENR